MLIGICGALCAGKQEVANYLVTTHGFLQLSIARPSLRQVDAGNREEGPGAAPLSSNTSADTFPDATELLDFVTKRWREKFVTIDIYNEGVLDILYKRPLFLLVSVDAPLFTRWQRCKQQGKPLISLEEFVISSDRYMYHPTFGLAPVLHRATIKLLNPSSSLPTLHRTLAALSLTSGERLRPSWDSYFMQLCSLAARRSNCMKRRVGCVLVRQERVISTGYNGTPRGLRNCNEGGCERCNSGGKDGHGLNACLCIHAEENALLEAGRERVGGGATLYCDTCPCLTCSIKIVQAGVVEVVYSEGYSMDTETAKVLEAGGVALRQHSLPRDGVVFLDESH